MPGENAEYSNEGVSGTNQAFMASGTLIGFGTVVTIVFWPAGVPILLTGAIVGGATVIYKILSKDDKNKTSVSTSTTKTNNAGLYEFLNDGNGHDVTQPQNKEIIEQVQKEPDRHRHTSKRKNKSERKNQQGIFNKPSETEKKHKKPSEKKSGCRLQ